MARVPRRGTGRELRRVRLVPEHPIRPALSPRLDIVAAAANGEIAAFCTISYDDATRSAVTVMVGTAAEHWRRGLGKAVMLEGMRRLAEMGCTHVFSTTTEEPAGTLYRWVHQAMKVTDTWIKEWAGGRGQ